MQYTGDFEASQLMVQKDSSVNPEIPFTITHHLHNVLGRGNKFPNFVCT